MSVEYEFFPEVVQNAYTKEQVACMQRYGYNAAVIEENARIKLRQRSSPPVPPPNSQSAICTLQRNPIYNVSTEASNQPSIFNNYGHGNINNTMFQPTFGGQIFHQQPSPFYTPDFYGPYSFQQPILPMSTAYQQSPVNIGHLNSVGNMSFSTSIYPPGRGQQFTPTINNMETSASYPPVYENHFTVPQTVTEQVVLPSNSGSSQLNPPPEADPQAMPNDSTSSLLDEALWDQFFDLTGGRGEGN